MPGTTQTCGAPEACATRCAGRVSSPERCRCAEARSDSRRRAHHHRTRRHRRCTRRRTSRTRARTPTDIRFSRARRLEARCGEFDQPARSVRIIPELQPGDAGEHRQRHRVDREHHRHQVPRAATTSPASADGVQPATHPRHREQGISTHCSSDTLGPTSLSQHRAARPRPRSRPVSGRRNRVNSTPLGHHSTASIAAFSARRRNTRTSRPSSNRDGGTQRGGVREGGEIVIQGRTQDGSALLRCGRLQRHCSSTADARCGTGSASSTAGRRPAEDHGARTRRIASWRRSDRIVRR